MTDILNCPVYVTDEDVVQCNAHPCPTDGFLNLPGRRVTLADVIQGVRDHISAHQSNAGEAS